MKFAVFQNASSYTQFLLKIKTGSTAFSIPDVPVILIETDASLESSFQTDRCYVFLLFYRVKSYKNCMVLQKIKKYAIFNKITIVCKAKQI